MLNQLSPAIRQYLVVTGNYWAFTLTDGALQVVALSMLLVVPATALTVPWVMAPCRLWRRVLPAGPAEQRPVGGLPTRAGPQGSSINNHGEAPE